MAPLVYLNHYIHLQMQNMLNQNETYTPPNPVEYEVWQGGFMSQGDHAPTKAMFLGKYVAVDFRHACDIAVTNNDLTDLYDRERLTIWGCGLYDNASEAIKGFG